MVQCSYRADHTYENDTFMTVPSMMIEIPEAKQNTPGPQNSWTCSDPPGMDPRILSTSTKRHKIGNEEISEIKAVSEALTPWCSG